MIPARPRNVVLLLAGAVLILTAHLGLMPLWGSEGRWAVIARQMSRSGDLLHPVIGTVPYWDKPLLSYWAVLPFSYVLGGTTEAAVRLPSVLAALVSLLLCFDLARSWFDRRVALLAAMILATSYGFVFWGRNAQVEMSNAAVILWAIWYFQRHKSHESARWLYVLGAVCGIGANLKGLPALAVPAFCIMVLSLGQRDWAWLPRWPHCLGAVGLTLLLYFAFPLAARWFTGDWGALELVWRENVVRFFSPFDHKDPVWTYFVRIFDLAAPWSLLLPAALCRYSPRMRVPASATAELLLCIGSIFVFFTLSGSRRPYYLLPILPFTSTLVALFIADFADNGLPRALDHYVRAFAVLVAIVLASPLAVFAILPDVASLPGSARAELLIWAVVLAAAGSAMLVAGVQRQVGGMFGAVFLGWFVYVVGILPVAAAQPDYRTDVERVRRLGRPCAFLEDVPAKVAYYLDEPCTVFHGEAVAYEWAVKADGVLVVQDDVPTAHWRPMVHSDRWDAVVSRVPAGADQLQTAHGMPASYGSRRRK